MDIGGDVRGEEEFLTEAEKRVTFKRQRGEEGI